LKDWPILLGPALRYYRMIRTKLEKTSKQRKARNLRKSLYVWSISTIEKAVSEKTDDRSNGRIDGQSHDYLGKEAVNSRDQDEGETSKSGFIETQGCYTDYNDG
jgi:hypothetical protein